MERGLTNKGASFRKAAGITGLIAPIAIAGILIASSPRPTVAQTRPAPASPNATQTLPVPETPESTVHEPETPDSFLNSSLVPPVYGTVRLGAFAGEAARLAGLTVLSTYGLGDAHNYERYRQAIRHCYGVDLEDMNYFSLDQRNFDERVDMLEKWILMAGQYGDVTLAIEPLGKEKYAIFHNKRAMERLRRAFDSANEHDITVWVRFASESNLPGSEYTAAREEKVAFEFYDAAAAFKKQMPPNVKLVFSPLINTFYLGRYLQKPLAKKMFYGRGNKNVVWDRIGGTIYRTNLPLESTFSFYYDFMSTLDGQTEFQVCEVGGPYSRRDEVMRFIDLCAGTKWPKLVKVNLFARDINSRADPNAQFGFLEPTERATKWRRAETSGQAEYMESWLKPKLTERLAR